MDNRAGGRDGGGHVGAAETVEGLHFEMLAEGEVSLVREEGVAIARLDAGDVGVSGDVFLGGDHLSGLDAGDFVRERVVIAELGETEVAGGEVEKSEAVPAFLPGMDGSEI